MKPSAQEKERGRSWTYFHSLVFLKFLFLFILFFIVHFIFISYFSVYFLLECIFKLEHCISLSRTSFPLLEFQNSFLLWIHPRFLIVSDKKLIFFSLPGCHLYLMRLDPVPGSRLYMSSKGMSGCCCTLCILEFYYLNHQYITCLLQINPMIVQSISIQVLDSFCRMDWKCHLRHYLFHLHCFLPIQISLR